VKKLHFRNAQGQHSCVDNTVSSTNSLNFLI